MRVHLRLCQFFADTSLWVELEPDQEITFE